MKLSAFYVIDHVPAPKEKQTNIQKHSGTIFQLHSLVGEIYLSILESVFGPLTWFVSEM